MIKGILRKGLVLLLMCSAKHVAGAPNIVFPDHFTNNVVADSDSEAGFWSVETQLNSTITESGGQVIITAARSNMGKAARAALTSKVDRRFNFFNSTGLTFSADFYCGGTSGIAGDSANRVFRFYLGDVAGANLTQTANYLSVQVLGTGKVQLTKKVNGNVGTMVNDVSMSGLPDGFSLHLDDQSFTLHVIYNAQTNTFTGAHGLDAAKWGTGSALTFNAQLGSLAPTNAATVMGISRFTVTSELIPPVLINVSSVVPGEHPSGLLIHNGKAYASLVIPAGAGAAEKYAAGDLQKVLYDITGVALPIVTDTHDISGNRVLIGNTRFTGGVISAAERSGLGKEEYIVRLAGRDMALVGGGPYGTIYSVAELYDLLGARWYMPGELGACLPHLNEVVFQSLDVRRAPSFAMRWIGNDLQWDMRQRQNRVLSADNMPPAFSVNPDIYHTQRNFMPDKYFSTHPEYFALVNGERSRDSDHRKLCNGSPEVAQVLAQNMSAFLRNNPGVDLISLSPTDGGLWCECGLCTALDEPGVPGDQRYSRRQMVLYNRVAARLGKEFPDQKILVGAYNVYTWPPADPEMKAHSNLAVIITHYAPYCLAHPTGDPDCPANQRYLELIKRWRQQVSDVYIYEYYLKGNWMGLPWPIMHTVREDIPFLHGLGVKGMYSQYSRNYLWGDFLDQYVAARLLWNHTEDVGAVLNEFYSKFYGSAAPAMRKYHELLEGQMATNGTCIDGNAPKNFQHVFPEVVLLKMQEYIDEAQRLTADTLVLKRLGKMALLTDYTKKFCGMLNCYNRAKGLTGAEASAEYLRALNLFREIDRDVLANSAAYEGILDRNQTLYRPMMTHLVAELKAGSLGRKAVKDDKSLPDDQRLD